MRRMAQEDLARQADAETRLRGRRLQLARAVWLLLALVELAALIDRFYENMQRLFVPCTDLCVDMQLPLQSAQALQQAGISLGVYAAFVLSTMVISTLVSFAIAGMLLWRRSDDWMALLVSLLLLSFAPTITSTGSYFTELFPLTVAQHVSAFVDQINLGVTVLAFFLFPTGHFVPRWTRWEFLAGMAFSVYLIVFPRYNGLDTLDLVAVVPFFIVLLSLVGAQVYRYRVVSTSMQRQQTKWVVYGLAVTIIVIVSAFVTSQFAWSYGHLIGPVSDALVVLNLMFVPLSFGVAMLRYRLYDIDLLINRTLVYLMLTAILAAIYVGGILSTQALLSGVLDKNNSFAIVLSTLVIAALFQPLRRRIQRVVDRRFYRSKYDAAQTLRAFSATLRNEVDLAATREHLLTVVEETLRPAHASLWLRPPEPKSVSSPLRNSPL